MLPSGLGCWALSLFLHSLAFFNVTQVIGPSVIDCPCDISVVFLLSYCPSWIIIYASSRRRTNSGNSCIMRSEKIVVKVMPVFREGYLFIFMLFFSDIFEIMEARKKNSQWSWDFALNIVVMFWAFKFELLEICPQKISQWSWGFALYIVVMFWGLFPPENSGSMPVKSVFSR